MRIVIIGAGQAAAQAVATLASEGFTGSITLIGDEDHPPYERPPLSKAVLQSADEPAVPRIGDTVRFDELGIAHAAGNRALVEWVRPNRHGAWNSCRLDRPRRRGTVRDVQKALGRSARYRGRGVEAGFSLT